MSFSDFLSTQPTVPQAVKYSDIYFDLQTIHRQAGVDAAIMRTADSQDARCILDQNAPDKNQWVQKLSAMSTNPLFVYEVFRKHGETKLAETALSQWLELRNKEIDSFSPKSNNAAATIFHAAFGRSDNHNYQVAAPTLMSEEQVVQAIQKLQSYCTSDKNCILPKLEPEQFQDICRRSSLLGKLILFNSKNTLPRKPEDDRDLILMATGFDEFPTNGQQIVMRMFRNSIVKYSVNASNAKKIKDVAIQCLLKCAPNLEEIDISNCIHLTPNAFSTGHPRLWKLVANDTSIEKNDIDRRCIPNLTEFQNRSPKKICKLDSNNIPESFDMVSVIIDPNMKELDKILSKFVEKPSLMVLNSLQSLNERKLSIQLFNEDSYYQPLTELGTQDFELKLVQALLNAYKSLTSKHLADAKYDDRETKKKEFTEKLADMLVKIWSEQKHLEVTRTLSKMILDILQNETEEPLYHDRTKRVNAWSNKNDVLLVQSLLNSLRVRGDFCVQNRRPGSDQPVNENSYDQGYHQTLAKNQEERFLNRYGDGVLYKEIVIKNAYNGLKNAIEVVFDKSCKKEHVYSDTRRNSMEILSVDTFAEILVEMSHTQEKLPEEVQKSLKSSLFALATYPQSRTYQRSVLPGAEMGYLGSVLPKKEHTICAGTFYNLIFDRAVAAILVCNQQSTADREEVLTALLENLPMMSLDGNYPVAKIVTGIIEEQDIPESERNGVLAYYLTRYKGVFSENISPQLKEKFTVALEQGGFGKGSQLEQALKSRVS